jgi:hypothetical protein
MSEHQRETAFLKEVIVYDGSDERRKLEQSIGQVQRDQRCVKRLFLAIALFLMLTLGGLAYGAILDKSFPYTLPEVAFKGLCEALLASLICLAGLAGLFLVYHAKLNRLREDCRRVIKRLLESRLDKLHIATVPDREPGSNAGEAANAQKRNAVE